MIGTPSENARTLPRTPIVGNLKKTLTGLFPESPRVPETPKSHEEPLVVLEERNPKDPIQAVVDVMIQGCREGGAAEWVLIGVFPSFQQWHWAAYAAQAKVPPPNSTIVKMIKQAYAERIGCTHLLDALKEA